MKKKKGKSGGTAQTQQGYLVPALTKRRWLKELRATTDFQFRPAERQLAQETRASYDQEKRIGSWFDQYKNTVSGGRAATDAAYSQAQQDWNSRQTQSRSQDDALREQLRAQEGTDAALRGGHPNPQMGYDFGGAQIARQQTADNYQGNIGNLRASQFSYLQDKERTGEGERANQLLKESARRRSLNADKRELAQKKGDWRTSYRGEQRAAEREWDLANRELGEKGAYRSFAKGQARQSANQDRKYRNFAKNQQGAGFKHDAKQAGIYGPAAQQKASGGANSYTAEEKQRAKAILAEEMGGKMNILGTDAKARKLAFNRLVGSRGVAGPLAKRLIGNYKKRGEGPGIGSKGWAKETKKRSGR